MKHFLPASLSKALRLHQTDAEKKLWYWLRNRQINQIKFRRQQRIDNYIVDFVSFKYRLIIELDGGQHNTLPTLEKDKERTSYLEQNGFRVLRFWNNDVLSNIDGVIAVIQEELIKQRNTLT